MLLFDAASNMIFGALPSQARSVRETRYVIGTLAGRQAVDVSPPRDNRTFQGRVRLYLDRVGSFWSLTNEVVAQTQGPWLLDDNFSGSPDQFDRNCVTNLGTLIESGEVEKVMISNL